MDFFFLEILYFVGVHELRANTELMTAYFERL